MTYTLAQRREILASMPWVAVSPAPELFRKRCEGYVTDMPMYAREMGGSVRAKWACKKRARWVFLALDGTIRTYCWWHLFSEGHYGSREEMDRYQNWLDQYTKTHPDPPDWTNQEPDEPLSRH